MRTQARSRQRANFESRPGRTFLSCRKIARNMSARPHNASPKRRRDIKYPGCGKLKCGEESAQGICGMANGRVLGYDNSHGYHHRHFMGSVEPVEFKDYEALNERFRSEVKEL